MKDESFHPIIVCTDTCLFLDFTNFQWMSNTPYVFPFIFFISYFHFFCTFSFFFHNFYTSEVLIKNLAAIFTKKIIKDNFWGLAGLNSKPSQIWWSKVEAKPGKWRQARFYGMPKLKETCMPILKNRNKKVRPMYLPAMFSLADANKGRLTLQSI